MVIRSIWELFRKKPRAPQRVHRLLRTCSKHGRINGNQRIWGTLFWDKVPCWLRCFRHFKTTSSILIHVYVYIIICIHFAFACQYIYIYVLFIMFLIYVLFVVLLFNYCSHFIYSFLMRMAMERDIIYTIRLWHFDSWSWLVSICAFASWVPVAELMKLFFSRDALVMRLGPRTTSTNYGAWHWAHENLQETLVSNMVKKMWKVFFP